MSRIRRYAVPLALGLGLLAGCENAVEPQEPGILDGLGPGIHPVVVLTSANGGNASVELQLKRIGVDAKIASFQGEFVYDAQRLSLAGAEMSPGLMGAWNETAPGTVRFAGAAAEGLAQDAVLKLRFTTKGTVAGDAFRVRLEELVSSTDFQDLAPRLIARDQPLFSPAPLD
jgi:hypothetical protein